MITVINRPYAYLRQSSKFHHQASLLQNYISACNSFHLFLVRIILIRTAIGIHWYNSAGDDALKVMLGTVKRNHG